MTGTPDMLPHDRYNLELEANVHPPGWVNPKPAPMYNLVVVGAGTAGLVAAAGAAGLGAKVALIEKRFLGGDCLNLGCVPSKTIISSSRIYEEVREAAGHGIKVMCGAEADFPAVMERMRMLRAQISVHDSARRFRELGVDVFMGAGVFTGHNSLDVAGRRLNFRKALIATGAGPFHPPVEGLSDAGYLTNETVFSLTERPKRLAVLGGGAIGCELAQAFGRLGSDVTILHNKSRLMDREDEEASAVLHRVFTREGLRIVTGEWKLVRVERDGAQKALVMERGSEQERILADEILVAVGRVPNVSGLGLEDAGVKYDARAGIAVDDGLRSSNPDIYAAGDACLKFKFTHTADAAARIVIQNALFFGHKKLSALTVPWCTFTDPEVAHVGLYEGETFMIPMSEVDRSVMEGDLDGFVKVHVEKGTDRILGATIVSAHAGEMIGELVLAMTEGIGLKKLSEVIHPYPTRSEAIKNIADQYNRTRLTPSIKGLLARWLAYKR